MNRIRKQKAGRNEPCPCASGKKYKKCCMGLADITDQEVFPHLEKLKQRQVDKGLRVSSSEAHDLARMSEVILDYARELLDFSPTYEAKEHALFLAIMAWNLALEEEEKGMQHLNDLLHRMKIPENSSDWNDMSDILKALIYKKQMEYPLFDRFVVDYQFSETEDGFHLSVASTNGY